jgi:hypothetical protein
LLRVYGGGRAIVAAVSLIGDRIPSGLKPSDSGGNRQRRQIIDPAEAPQACDTRAEGLVIEQRSEVSFHVSETGQDFIDRPQIGPVGLIEAGEGPRLKIASASSCSVGM